jgi:hypothetical protein
MTLQSKKKKENELCIYHENLAETVKEITKERYRHSNPCYKPKNSTAQIIVPLFQASNQKYSPAKKYLLMKTVMLKSYLEIILPDHFLAFPLQNSHLISR